MKRILVLAVSLASSFAIPPISFAQFASEATSYNPGTRFAAGYTNPSAALGAPA
ncbi:MAG TPA: hypothetical protein VN873_15005 [Candidatus Angelobacter sp.]|nr:hypothetical protein [Candidatus Angelobacter sp.]